MVRAHTSLWRSVGRRAIPDQCRVPDRTAGTGRYNRHHDNRRPEIYRADRQTF